MQIPTVTADAIAVNEAAEEVQRARGLHGPMASSHEAYAVILEELEEFWDEVKKKREQRSEAAMATELKQLAAMALRARVDLGLVKLATHEEKAVCPSCKTDGPCECPIMG